MNMNTTAIQVNPFTVTKTTQWVSITLQISAAHAEHVESLPENIRADLGADLNIHALRVAAIINAQPVNGSDCLRQVQETAAGHGSLAATESKPVSFPMLADQWNDFQAIAARAGITPENLALAAIAARITQIMRFTARRRPMAGAAA